MVVVNDKSNIVLQEWDIYIYEKKYTRRSLALLHNPQWRTHYVTLQHLLTENRGRLHSKQETLHQCWFDVGPASKTIDQHQTNIDPTLIHHRVNIV